MKRLGIVAGGGDLPKQLAEHAAASGRDPFIVGLAGFADPDLVAAFGGVMLSIGEFGKHIDALRTANVEEMVFAGSIKRPDLRTLKFDFRGTMVAPKLLAAATKGDDALLRVAVGVYEDAGFCVIGADNVLGDLLAPRGALGQVKPAQEHWPDIRLAAKTASAIGELDVGQGAVARGGEIIATEAADGTDAMLARVAAMSAGFTVRTGVLVKRPKPQQERRIDLPTIGAATVRGAAAAGLAGVAVEEGGALVLARAEVALLADELGLFVYGFTAEELA